MNRDIQSLGLTRLGLTRTGLTRRKLVRLAAGMSVGTGLATTQTARGGATEFRT
jgi:hypothetical protein